MAAAARLLRRHSVRLCRTIPHRCAAAAPEGVRRNAAGIELVPLKLWAHAFAGSRAAVKRRATAACDPAGKGERGRAHKEEEKHKASTRPAPSCLAISLRPSTLPPTHPTP